MKKISNIGIILFFLSITLQKVFSANLTSMDFYQEGEESKLVLTFDQKKIKAKKTQIIEDKQIILDLEAVSATDRVMRAFDTSEFQGSVIFVSAYKRPGNPQDLRISLQLRDNVRSVLSPEDNKLVLSIENRFGVFTQKKIEEAKLPESQIAKGVGKSKINIPKSTSLQDILENLVQSGKKKYVGKKISFNVKNIDVGDLLKMIADISGFNIILGEEINSVPPLTLTLSNIAWDQALDTIMELSRLVATKNGAILMVTTIDKANEERRKILEAEKLQESKEPIVTKIYPVSFAAIAELATLLAPYTTPERGSIQQDIRTNSLILKDTVENIDIMVKIIETLDTQTPQILIESKIVEAKEDFAREIGLKNGITFGYDPIGAIGDPVGPGFSFATAPSVSGANAFSFTVGTFRRLLNLDVTLQLMESESKGKIISSPSVITQNKKKAQITATDTTSFSTSNTQVGTIQNSFQGVDATLSLEVEPQVTNEGSIVLDVKVASDAFGTRPASNAPPDKTSRTLNTNVLVDNGSTVVLGGVYKYIKNESHSGIPFLKDLPLVGWLFRTPYNPTQSKSELIIFLTPRIINQEEAGLTAREDESISS